MAYTWTENLDVAVPVRVTGHVTVNSGAWGVSQISGQTLQLQSGTTVQLPATQVVKISGDTVSITSGQTVQLPSTQVVKISGEVMDVAVPVGVKTGGIHPIITGASGGVVLGSGAVKSVFVKTLKTNSGIVYVGGSGIFRPYSGYGLTLEPGDGVNLDVANFDAVYIVSTISGFAVVSYAGVN